MKKQSSSIPLLKEWMMTAFFFFFFFLFNVHFCIRGEVVEGPSLAIQIAKGAWLRSATDMQ